VAPALVLVGALMMDDLKELDRKRAEESLPPLLMVLFTVCTMDLMAGLAIGCFTYTLFAVSLRQWKKVNATLLGLDVVFALYLILRNRIV
jgi:AGZA family xanthine/uracil permease-like MFS transporter